MNRVLLSVALLSSLCDSQLSRARPNANIVIRGADNQNESTSLMTDEERLYQKLMLNYKTVSRPVYDASKSVVVYFGLALVQIQRMDEVNQVLTTYVWFEKMWTDERLTWNPENYHNLSVFRIPSTELWTPDIELYNSAHEDTYYHHETRAMVQSNGSVFYPPLAKLSSTCRIDITYYPFDHQTCKLKFGSWTYDTSQLDFRNRSDTIDLVNYVKNGEWDLEDVGVERNLLEYPCCPGEFYSDVTFSIHLRRRALFYWTNIIFPSMWLTIINVVSFALPPESGERVSLGITVFLSFSVFMLLVAENTPTTSDTVPLLGMYIAVDMALNASCLILAVMLYNFYHSSPLARRPLPNWIRKLIINQIDTNKNNAQSQRKHRSVSVSTVQSQPAVESRKYSEVYIEDRKLPDNTNETQPNYERRNGTISHFPAKKISFENFFSASNVISKRLWFRQSRSQATTDSDGVPSAKNSPEEPQSPCLPTRLIKRKSEQSAIMKEWKVLTTVLDRILLVIFIFVSLMTNVIFLFVVPALST